MKIAIDVRCLMEGRRTGVEEYTLGLLQSLFKLDRKNEYILFLNSWKEPNFDFGIFADYKNVSLKRLKIPNKLLNLAFWYLAWPKIDQLCGNADVVFMPNIIFGAVIDEQMIDQIRVTLIATRFDEHRLKLFNFKKSTELLEETEPLYTKAAEERAAKDDARTAPIDLSTSDEILDEDNEFDIPAFLRKK